MRSISSAAVRACAPQLPLIARGMLCAGLLFVAIAGHTRAAGDPSPAAAAVASDDKTAGAPAADAPQMPEEQKQKVKTVVLMLSILSGIALTGLLLIIASIVIRGLQRKLAGPTRLDPRPQDMLTQAMAAPGSDPSTADPTTDDSAAAEETLYT